MSKSREDYEQNMAQKAIENYESEKKNGKLKKLSSLAETLSLSRSPKSVNRNTC